MLHFAWPISWESTYLFPRALSFIPRTTKSKAKKNRHLHFNCCIFAEFRSATLPHSIRNCWLTYDAWRFQTNRSKRVQSKFPFFYEKVKKFSFAKCKFLLKEKRFWMVATQLSTFFFISVNWASRILWKRRKNDSCW